MTNNVHDTISMYSRDEHPFGRTWEEWTTKWWLWFLSISKKKNPAFDESGEKAIIGQKDPDVWFLAATTGGTAERIVTLPTGKALLFPVINATTSYSEEPGLKTDYDLTSYVKTHIDDIVIKEASIDGLDLVISENHRVQSPPFDFFYPEKLPKDNVYFAHGGHTRGAGDGYWIFLKPLFEGKHNIRTFGSCMSGRVQIGISWYLIIEDTAKES
jgi:hypothetical protein